MKKKCDSQPLAFAGDLFVSQEDDTNVVKIIESITKENILVVNLEGAPDIKIQSDRPPKKNTNLKLNNKFLCEVRNLNKLYLSLVNNHITDCDLPGYKFIKDTLGDKALYSSSDEVDPRKFINGRSLLFFADEREECLCNLANFLRFDLSIINANSQFINGSIVIVHGGIEYRRYPTYYQRKLSMRLIELGAHSVIFHHSHVQGVHEWYKGKLIHYGLGNYYFSRINTMHGLDATDGCVIRVRENEGDYEIARIEYKRSNDSSDLRCNLIFGPLENNSELPEMGEYKSWYKKSYKINSSLRPRQLFSSEILNRFQYKLWYAFASRISRAGLSSRLKLIIRSFIFE